MAHPSSRRLVVVLHADIVSSTSLVRQNETLAHQRIQDTFHRLSDCVSSFHGLPREIRGDAMVAEFGRASDAVCAALKFQSEQRDFLATLSDDLRPVSRIGIAHDCYLQAKALLYSVNRSRENFEKLFPLFEKTISLDPDFGEAYAGLAMTYNLDYQNHWTNDWKQAFNTAVHYSDIALSKSPNSDYVQYVASVLAFFGRDLEKSALHGDRALELNPNNALVLNGRGLLYGFTGQPEKGIALIEKAIRVDPAFRSQYMHFLGLICFVAERYEETVQWTLERLKSYPESDLSRGVLVSALVHMGRNNEAAGYCAELLSINPDYSPVEHSERLPFEKQEQRQQFLNGFTLAGIILK